MSKGRGGELVGFCRWLDIYQLGDWNNNRNKYFRCVIFEQFAYQQSKFRRMMKFNANSKQSLSELMNRTGTQYGCYPSGTLDPKFLPSRPPNIIISKKISGQNNYQPVLTPKTARANYENYASMNTSFNRSTHLTPDKDKNKKETSFATPVKSKKVDSSQYPTHNQNLAARTENKSAKTDRSQRVLKTNILQDMANKQTQNKTFLRQTVSNSTAWQYKNLIPPSPIKTFNDIKKQKDKTPDIFRKKNDLEYLSAYPEDPPKQMKSKYSTQTHSRKNSEEDKGLQVLNFKARPYPPTDLSHRTSQDNLTQSHHLRRDKTMSQTDPNGTSYQTVLSKRSSVVTPRREQHSEPKIQDFQLGPCKGEGRFGKVFPALHKRTGWLIAIKQIKKEDVRLMLDQFVQQIKINLFADHPNVVKMYGLFSDRTHFYIMMEYMEEGSLYKTIKLKKKLRDDEANQKLYQICDAVNYLHSNDILHRDIKPENIVLSNGVCKLCDFGWAIYSKERRTTYCGTLDYVCPEILQGQSYDNFVDIWAIGVLAYEMLTGKAPFYHISRKETMKSILNCQFSFPNEMSINAKMFIKKALQKLPDQRFTIESLLHDKFLSGCNTRV